MLVKVRRVDGDLVAQHFIPDVLYIHPTSNADPRILHIQDYYHYWLEMRHLTDDCLALFHALLPHPTPQILPGAPVWAWATYCKYATHSTLTKSHLAATLARYVPPEYPALRFDWPHYLIAATNLDARRIKCWKTVDGHNLLQFLKLPDVTFHCVNLLHHVSREQLPAAGTIFPPVLSGGIAGVALSALGILSLAVLIFGAPVLAYYDVLGTNESDERFLISWLRVLSLFTWIEALVFFVAKSLHRRQDILSDIVRFRMGGIGDSHRNFAWQELQETENGLYDYMKQMWRLPVIESDEAYRLTVRWFILALCGEQVHAPGQSERQLMGQGYWLRAAASVVSNGPGQTWTSVLHWDHDMTSTGELLPLSATEDPDDIWYLFLAKSCWLMNRPLIRDIPSYVKLMTGNWSCEERESSFNMAYATQRVTPNKAKAFRLLLDASLEGVFGDLHLTTISRYGDLSVSGEPAEDTLRHYEAVEKGVSGWFDTTGSIVSQIGIKRAVAEHWFAWLLAVGSLVIQMVLVGCSGLLFDGGNGVENQWLHVAAEGAGLASLVALVTNYVCEIIWRSERVWYHGLRGRSTAQRLEMFCKQRMRGFANNVGKRRAVAAVYGTMIFSDENNSEMTGANGIWAAEGAAKCLVTQCYEITTVGEIRGKPVHLNGHAKRVEIIGDGQWRCPNWYHATYIMSRTVPTEEVVHLQ